MNFDKWIEKFIGKLVCFFGGEEDLQIYFYSSSPKKIGEIQIN